MIRLYSKYALDISLHIALHSWVPVTCKHGPTVPKTTDKIPGVDVFVGIRPKRLLILDPERNFGHACDPPGR
jgi:hypothetical protein